ncbi:GH13647 [Drosophila grimshawi]|uniref:GH13647 n=1 Tax=Drosophila grimshawi TaxID=7222 RepID=B4JQ63_DROGR|nr:GH13647 [Drosophila grimshawi]
MVNASVSNKQTEGKQQHCGSQQQQQQQQQQQEQERQEQGQDNLVLLSWLPVTQTHLK